MRNAVKERSLFLESGEIRLEALFAELQGARGAVITHPHPLYGGDMHNSVVEAAVSAYRESGISTLRFNFQGVGRSGGAFDQGLGERANVLSAVKSMSDSGRDKIDLVGYSFGAWVNAGCLQMKPAVERMVFISPPVTVLDFSFMQSAPSLKLVVTGSNDAYAPPEAIRKMIPLWNGQARLELIEGADHFYQGYLDRVRDILKDFLVQTSCRA